MLECSTPRAAHRGMLGAGRLCRGGAQMYSALQRVLDRSNTRLFIPTCHFPVSKRRVQSEGWIAWHVYLGTALRAYVVYALILIKGFHFNQGLSFQSL